MRLVYRIRMIAVLAQSGIFASEESSRRELLKRAQRGEEDFLL